MTTYCVVLAESTRAKVFTFEKGSQTLEEKYDLVHVQGRLRDRDLNSDKPGRSMGSDGIAHHGVERMHRRQKNERSTFAREISDRLDADRSRHKFDGLILIASPHFLGELREKLTRSCKNLVIRSIDKNLLHCSNEEILDHLSI